jgi:hypothetical protein
MRPANDESERDMAKVRFYVIASSSSPLHAHLSHQTDEAHNFFSGAGRETGPKKVPLCREDDPLGICRLPAAAVPQTHSAGTAQPLPAPRQTDTTGDRSPGSNRCVPDRSDPKDKQWRYPHRLERIARTALQVLMRVILAGRNCENPKKTKSSRLPKGKGTGKGTGPMLERGGNAGTGQCEQASCIALGQCGAHQCNLRALIG